MMIYQVCYERCGEDLGKNEFKGSFPSQRVRVLHSRQCHMIIELRLKAAGCGGLSFICCN